MDEFSRVEVLRRVIKNPELSWVLFQHGTCVLVPEPAADLAMQATETLKEDGPVHAGSALGDFATLVLAKNMGWGVTSHREEIFTLVGPGELSGAAANSLSIGLLGRSKRSQDASELTVIHVEGRRSGAPDA